MSAGWRIVVFVWWLTLETVTVYAMAHPSSRTPDLGDWVMGAMMGTMLASMFCAGSVGFIAWTFFKWNP